MVDKLDRKNNIFGRVSNKVDDDCFGYNMRAYVYFNKLHISRAFNALDSLGVFIRNYEYTIKDVLIYNSALKSLKGNL